MSVTIQLLGESYHINLNDGDSERLNQSAKLYDQYLQKIRDSGGIVGTERIAMMAGLNMAHDFIDAKNQQQEDQALTDDIRQLCEKIEQGIKPLMPHTGS